MLAGRGRSVRLVTSAIAFGEAVHQYQRNMYLGRLDEAGVELVHHLRLVAVGGGRAGVPKRVLGARVTLEGIDTLVVNDGRSAARAALFEALQDAGADVVRVGDALGPRSFEEAIREGTEAGLADLARAGRILTRRLATPVTARIAHLAHRMRRLAPWASERRQQSSTPASACGARAAAGRRRGGPRPPDRTHRRRRRLPDLAAPRRRGRGRARRRRATGRLPRCRIPPAPSGTAGALRPGLRRDGFTYLEYWEYLPDSRTAHPASRVRRLPPRRLGGRARQAARRRHGGRRPGLGTPGVERPPALVGAASGDWARYPATVYRASGSHAGSFRQTASTSRATAGTGPPPLPPGCCRPTAPGAERRLRSRRHAALAEAGLVGSRGVTTGPPGTRATYARYAAGGQACCLLC